MKKPTRTYAALSARIAAIRARHRDLDAQVVEEQKSRWPDAPVLQRLKRRRLRLKDELNHHEGLLRTLSRGRAVG